MDGTGKHQFKHRIIDTKVACFPSYMEDGSKRYVHPPTYVMLAIVGLLESTRGGRDRNREW
jgi:hypothetical protein